jgi:uncharacterized membrane protein
MDIMSLLKSAANDRKGLLRIYRFISIVGIVLILGRLFFVSDKAFLFILWNFFLAGLPLIISSVMIQMSARGFSRYSITFAGILWLLFLPNAPYILTDYVHVIHGDPNYFLLNTFTFSWFAISAFVAAVISLHDVSDLLLMRYKRLQVSMMIFTICLLCSLGIYLGRDLRFNTWDVFLNPGAIVSETMDSLRSPSENFYTWTITTTIGLLLFLGYYGMKLVKSRI